MFIYLSVFAWIFFCVNLPNLHNSFVILNAIAGFFFTPMSQRVEAVAHSDKIYALAVMFRYVRALKRKKERKTKKIHKKRNKSGTHKEIARCECKSRKKGK